MLNSTTRSGAVLAALFALLFLAQPARSEPAEEMPVSRCEHAYSLCRSVAFTRVMSEDLDLAAYQLLSAEDPNELSSLRLAIASAIQQGRALDPFTVYLAALDRAHLMSGEPESKLPPEADARWAFELLGSIQDPALRGPAELFRSLLAERLGMGKERVQRHLKSALEAPRLDLGTARMVQGQIRFLTRSGLVQKRFYMDISGSLARMRIVEHARLAEFLLGAGERGIAAVDQLERLGRRLESEHEADPLRAIGPVQAFAGLTLQMRALKCSFAPVSPPGAAAGEGPCAGVLSRYEARKKELKEQASAEAISDSGVTRILSEAFPEAAKANGDAIARWRFLSRFGAWYSVPSNRRRFDEAVARAQRWKRLEAQTRAPASSS